MTYTNFSFTQAKARTDRDAIQDKITLAQEASYARNVPDTAQALPNPRHAP